MAEMNELSKSITLDLNVNATYVIADGQLIKLDNPKNGFGKQELSWQKGKVVHVAYKYNQTI